GSNSGTVQNCYATGSVTGSSRSVGGLVGSNDSNGTVQNSYATEISCHEEIDEMGFSAINELSNIMSASFVGAIADMSELAIDISPPEATLDMLGSIMSVPSIYFAKMSDSLLLIQSELEVAGKTTKTSVLLLPDMPSLEKLMTSLGIET
ncbi:MAG: chemotaxis protein CheC, partial [Cystobacterineae bacterium]|nr:chemotaxis protein CheC [Cystobacterineae bacterium]